ncbi:hypothetical protein GW17_00042536 [Ensete ventricosum]|nr:hypothetical protein GW17_00042536 [Ensete ventricosum]
MADTPHQPRNFVGSQPSDLTSSGPPTAHNLPPRGPRDGAPPRDRRSSSPMSSPRPPRLTAHERADKPHGRDHRFRERKPPLRLHLPRTATKAAVVIMRATDTSSDQGLRRLPKQLPLYWHSTKGEGRRDKKDQKTKDDIGKAIKKETERVILPHGNGRKGNLLFLLLPPLPHPHPLRPHFLLLPPLCVELDAVTAPDLDRIDPRRL